MTTRASRPLYPELAHPCTLYQIYPYRPTTAQPTIPAPRNTAVIPHMKYCTCPASHNEAYRVLPL